MTINFTGAILSVLPQAQGVSAAGQPWVKQEYVIEDINQQYPSRCCFEVFGEDKIKQFAIRQGELLRVSLNLTSNRAKDGRWYNRITCFHVVHLQSPGTLTMNANANQPYQGQAMQGKDFYQGQPQQTQQPQQSSQQQQDTDKLPF